MMKRLLTIFISGAAGLLLCGSVGAQRMTLAEALDLAGGQSVEALAARNEFVSAYWAWRSYKASRLPSVVLYGNLMNFDRSLTLLQNFENGNMVYANTYNLQNSLGLAVNQNVTFTGGTLSLYTDLSRIDQYGKHAGLTWYAQPVTLSYNQPLMAYNRFKWDKMIEPIAYEKAKRHYLEQMEEVGIRTVGAFYDLVLAREKQAIALSNYENSGMLHAVARERLALGSITRDEYLQLEMRMLADSIQINETAIGVRAAQMALNSILGLDERTEVTPAPDEVLPDLYLDYDRVLDLALNRATFQLNNRLEILQAQSEVARAKANRGISMTLNARFGLSKTGAAIRDVYLQPIDQEVVGLSFSVPIFDWGLGRGRVQKAQAAQAVVEASALQSENDFRRDIFSKVAQFNSQRDQCTVSRRAAAIARERYALVMERFRAGAIGVTELNNAQTEKDNAASKYINDLATFWKSYYTLRKAALYDFIGGKELDVDPEKMMSRP